METGARVVARPAWQSAGVGWSVVVVVLAVLARVVLAIVLDTNGDIENMRQASGILRDAPLGLYTLQQGEVWPYLGGYLPLLALERVVAGSSPHAFAVVQRLVVIAANLGLAWLLDSELRRQGAGRNARLAAATVVLLSPLFVLESAWHGQLDLPAVLLATGAVVAWERAPAHLRAPLAGGLCGAAAAVKTPLGVVALAFLPAVGSRRELLAFAGAAIAVPLGVCAPWLIRDAGAVHDHVLNYRGLPGLGGLSLVAQPHAAEAWFNGNAQAPNGALAHLEAHASSITLAGLVPAGLVLWRTRPQPAVGAVLVLLAVYATGVNWALYYLIWIVPFLLLAGWSRAAIGLQIALLVPALFTYWRGINGTLDPGTQQWSPTVTLAVYVPYMLAVWAASIVAFAALSRRLLRHAE